MRLLLQSSAVASSSRASRLGARLVCQHAFSTYTRQTARSTKALKRPRYRRDDSDIRVVPSGHIRPSNNVGSIFGGKKSNKKASKTFDVFRQLVLSNFDEVLQIHAYPLKKEEYHILGVHSQVHFERDVVLFRQAIRKACDMAGDVQDRKENPLFWSLRNAFVTGDIPALQTELKYSFQTFLMRGKFSTGVLSSLQNITDLRYPYEWFPATRALHRTVHLHVGPTNSGKTYNALKALENAKTGVYAGPLRLLAHEVYSRFMAKGKTCALITGEEQRIPENTDVFFRSCTVEMAPLNLPVDVAVIDEIQMIGDQERGWAWTQAFLGLQAKELHLCGEERAVELIQSLCASVGDECVVHRYERLSPLETMDKSLNGQLTELQKGDAVVSFSRISIHGLKNQIESSTGKRCAIVYGSLPPETRAQQAALFNDPNNDYDYLVASDAIGMGLNLEIRRVVFETTIKRNAVGYHQISDSEIKQIGGRAGRFRTAHHAIQAANMGSEAAKSESEAAESASEAAESTSEAAESASEAAESTPSQPEERPPGLVTAFNDEDLAVIIKAFKNDLEPIKTAGLQPPTAALERLSTYFPPNTPLSYMLLHFRDIARLSPRFHFCSFKEMLQIAELIQPFPMSIYDRCVFLNAPAPIRDKRIPAVLQALARCVSRMSGGHILDIPEIDLDLLASTPEDQKLNRQAYLQRLEALHKSITLYLWLSYRFTGVFTSQHLGFHIKGLVEEKIDEQLSKVNQSVEKRRQQLEKIRKEAEARILEAEGVVDGEDVPTEIDVVDGEAVPTEIDVSKEIAA